MAEIDLAKAVAFSKKVLPSSIKGFGVTDAEGLVFLGRENLQSILDEWNLIERSSDLMVESIKGMNRRYNMKRSYDFYAQQAKKARVAKAIIAPLLDRCESKPIFSERRTSPKDFAVGETVFVSFAEDKTNCLVQCEVVGHSGNEVLITTDAFDEDGNSVKDEGAVVYTSDYLYSFEDLRYLALNPDYFVMYSSFSGLEDDDAKVLYAMIYSCMLHYYPDYKAQLSKVVRDYGGEIVESSDSNASLKA